MAMLRGSFPPLVTPFRNGRIDDAALVRLIEFQIENGSHGIGVTGTTGEPTSLSPEEREWVIELAVKTARGRVPVLAGTGSTNHAETLRFTAFAEKVGASAVLVIAPALVRPSQEGLYRHFRAVAESTRLPVILYNIPGRAAINIDPNTIARLARDCRNIIGVKEANTNFAQVSEVIARCGPEFNVYSGIEALCYPMLALGGAGHVSATGNVMPREVAELYNLCAAGKWEQARDLHYRLLELNDILFIETNPGPVKTALGLMGMIEPELRLPLAPMAPENERKLRDVLVRYGLISADTQVAREPVRADD